ncbi:MAG TPA: phospholipid carrier-dependent glycosyltransferase [Candidatus Binataceae bacterium]|nr:phospholipid carrier-dependent glycosyltransferase [Candidatus Binataceae bacterium]
MASGKPAGVVAGAILAALCCYALWLLARPLVHQRDRDLKGVLWLLTGLLALKAMVLPWFSGFSVDLGTYEAWAMKIAAVGPAHTYQQGYFLDYPPGYLYALWAAGALASALGIDGGLGLKVIVQMPPLIGDFALALAVYLSVRRLLGARSAWIALALVAFNPALLFDSVVWGQTDSPLTLTLFVSVAMMLEGEFEIAWGLAALSVLIKPQAFSLLPVFGLWTLLKLSPRRWWRSVLAFLAVVVVGCAPFQIGHPWSWLPDLYISGAAYYHETSVNAFNLMALIGGLRQADSQPVFGISYFAIGMTALLPLYAFVARVLWRAPDQRNLWFCSFLALFGFFMLAPRMHERYFYAAVVFAAPLALAEPAMLAVFVVLTVTCLFNLAYVLHALQLSIFLDSRDKYAMTASAVNLIALAAMAAYGWARTQAKLVGIGVGAEMAEEQGASALGKRANRASPKGTARKGKDRTAPIAASTGWFRLGPPPLETYIPFPWLPIDSIVLLAILAIAGALRFWNLGHPNELVFDEVHFVGQARHYLHGETFLDPHPPLAKLIIALGIKLFGDVPWAWRLGMATMGTLLSGVTYLLARRMFRSRLAAALAASFIVSDGLFLVDSRIAVIDIVYLTFAAISYLLMFRFIQNPDWRDRRRTLVLLGISLGLCLGSKLYVPAVTFLLVSGFIVYTLARPDPVPAKGADTAKRDRRIAGAVLILGGISAVFYIACFLPHYYLGWWGGIADLFHYYKDVMWYEKSVSTATHPYASPWWSWPLMLRPVAYWQNFPDKGAVATIWGAGNPILWWGVIPAITITAVRALERPNLTRTFLVIAYLANFVIWIPIGRILFLYHYMPSIFFGYLALGAILADFWEGQCELWETFAVLLTMLPALAVGLGHMAVALKPSFLPESALPAVGLPFVLLLTFAWIPLRKRPQISGRFVCLAFLGCAFGIFIYYLPVWIALPIARAGYYARMWLEGPGLRNWI